MYSKAPMNAELVGSTTEYMLYPDGSSGARVQMQGAHFQQSPPIVGNEPPLTFTGAGFEYAKYTFNIVAEETCRIERIIERRATNQFGDNNVLETILFVSIITDQNPIDVIVIPKYVSHHQYFGYELKQTMTFRKGQILKKGTVLAEVPNVINNEWCPGVNANAILASSQNVIEDAVWISQELADKMSSWGYKKHVMSIGPNEYPLIIYGTPEHPAIHPPIGGKVRDDGILMAKRKYDELLCAIEMSTGALREPDGHFDDCIFVNPKSEVVDIRVYRDEAGRKNLQTPEGMQQICDVYADALNFYYENIRRYYLELKREKKTNLTAKCRQLIEESIMMNPEMVLHKESPRKKQFGYEPLEDYRIEVTVRFPIPLAEAGKITDCFGGKGVVGIVVPTEDMPIDAYGNRVHIVMSDNAMLRRTNWNRGFEHLYNAARRDVQIRTLELADAGDYEAAWNYLMGFLEATTPLYAEDVARTHLGSVERNEYIDELRRTQLRVNIPIDTPLGMKEVEEAIKEKYPPRQSPLMMTRPDGSKVPTVEEFIVGELYIIRLDKTGRDMSAIGAGRFQHFGTIAKQHARDRARRPLREHPIKFIGESEARHLKAFVGRDLVEEVHDRSNNPIVADEVILNTLTAEHVMNIPCLVDRKRFPLGNNRSMAIQRHVDECDGVGFTTRED